MIPIGGFFELELPQGGADFHSNAIGLSTGRACISLFIEQVKPRKVYVPYYSCDAALAPFQVHNIPLEYYEININLEPNFLPILQDQEYFFYTNYFGVKEEYTLELSKLYGSSLLIDNTHCYFHKGYEGIWSFTSARKHFGVPDGAYLYPGKPLDVSYPIFEGITILPYFNRLMGYQELGFKQYQEYESSLNCDIKMISNYSKKILCCLNFEEARQRRINNFNYLHKTLKKYNLLGDIISTSPFCYPFWPDKEISHAVFHKQNVFIPFYWKEIQNRVNSGNSLSVDLSTHLLPLPIDHRYGKEEMDRMIEIILLNY